MKGGCLAEDGSSGQEGKNGDSGSHLFTLRYSLGGVQENPGKHGSLEEWMGRRKAGPASASTASQEYWVALSQLLFDNFGRALGAAGSFDLFHQSLSPAPVVLIAKDEIDGRAQPVRRKVG